MQRTSLTCGLSGGLTPYMKPATCVRRSALVTKRRSTFFGRTYVKPVSLMSSELT